MPGVSKSRIEVDAIDKASRPISGITNSYGRFSDTIRKSSNSLAQLNRQMGAANFGGFTNTADKVANSLANMNKTMERLVYSASRYLIIYQAFGAIRNVWSELVGGSYDYAKSLETNQIGIAGILKSMITLNGEQVKWNDAMTISGRAMKALQSEALRTAATSKELIETFRALLGPGLSSGMSIDQIVQLSTVGTNAVRSLGLPTNQYVQELRSIITEGIRPASSTLATSLGITNKDIKEAKASSEGLFNFLMSRMQGFSDAVKYTSGTVEGRIARIQEGLQVGGAKGTEGLYQSWSRTLEKVANYLIPVPENLGDKWEVNPGFVRSVQTVSEAVGKIVENLGNAGESFAPLFGGALKAGFTALDQFGDKLEYIIKFFAAKAAFPFIADLASIAVNSRDAYQAQTSLGRAIQSVSDKISGRTIELQKEAELQQRAIEIEKAYDAALQKTREIIAQQRKSEQSLPVWRMNPVTDAWKAESLTKFVAKLRELGTEEKRINELAEQYFNYLKKGTQEGAANIEKLVLAEEKEAQATEKQINAKKGLSLATKANIERASTLVSTFGGLSMSVGILCDALTQADEKNKEWYESAGNAAMTAGMFATAIGSIISIMPDLIDGVLKGARALKKFAEARTLAGLGLAGGIAAGVGAVVYNAYQNFKETGIASQLDEYGNVVSHDFSKAYVDDENLAVINRDDINYGGPGTREPEKTGTIGLNDFGGGGSGGGKGSSAKVDKAKEYAERMKKIVADLNKEMTNMRGNATAYEKAMAAAEDKIAGYQKEIVKAEQLGVDIAEVRKAQDDYMLAAKKKAVELQEDENLKYMKLNEEAANRINIMGQGTMEQQREVLAQRLEAHKAYLEQLLAAEMENKERRYQLEAQLAEVTKQIKDNAVYDFKQGWSQALDELANRQINFKETFVNAFGSIESSLVSLVSGTESAKEKFSKFCEEITKTILQSMAQIIIRGLITKAIMGAIGMTTNNSSMSNTDIYAARSLAMDNWLAHRASGGSVQAGGTYLVGEEGPEIVRFGSSGHVYNNRETRSMLGGGIQNIKVELKNESGTKLKAENAEVNFDLDTMILSVVIKGVESNNMGVRSMLKGLAASSY